MTQLIVAHELGHALGLGHEDRRCATMNSRGWVTPAGVRTTRCGARSWLVRPCLTDDLRGLRVQFRNHRPVARLKVTVDAFGLIDASDNSSDRDRDIVRRHVDWGNGTTSDLVEKRTFTPISTPPCWFWESAPSTYADAGDYTITLTVTDAYGLKSTTSTTVTAP